MIVIPAAAMRLEVPAPRFLQEEAVITFRSVGEAAGGRVEPER